MIEIIKKGNLEEENQKRENKRIEKLKQYYYWNYCGYCGCYFNFEYEDVKENFPFGKFVYCPQCFENVHFDDWFGNRYKKKK